MCSICGGSSWDRISEGIWNRSQDRGRDDHGKFISVFNGKWIGNHRAIPTTETESPSEKQPVGADIKMVFNGIISNDENLGKKEGEADTSVLPRVLDCSSLWAFRDSVFDKLIGSYAIATLNPYSGKIFLACNYKPIWILEYQGKKYFSSLASHFPPNTHPYRMDPYSVLDLFSGEKLPIQRRQSNKALVICSSGLDSTTVAAYSCKKHGPENVVLLHFDYGCQATNKEADQIKKIAQYLNCGYRIEKMPSFGGSSLLTKDGNISQGIEGAEYAHEWVPARNLVMLSITVSMAEALKFGHIYLGTNLEEAGAYPDNEEQFILDFNNLLYGAVQNGVKIQIHTPLGGLMKHEIIPFGMKYDTPYHLTWSCYRGGDKHCGKCGPCYMRKTAFERNGLQDPVLYEKEKK